MRRMGAALSNLNTGGQQKNFHAITASSLRVVPAKGSSALNPYFFTTPKGRGARQRGGLIDGEASFCVGIIKTAKSRQG